MLFLFYPAITSGWVFSTAQQPPAFSVVVNTVIDVLDYVPAPTPDAWDAETTVFPEWELTGPV